MSIVPSNARMRRPGRYRRRRRTPYAPPPPAPPVAELPNIVTSYSSETGVEVPKVTV